MNLSTLFSDLATAKLLVLWGTKHTINTSLSCLGSWSSYLYPKEVSVNPRIEDLEIGIWWYNRLFQHHDGLNHTCNSTSTPKVSDVTFDSPTE